MRNIEERKTVNWKTDENISMEKWWNHY